MRLTPLHILLPIMCVGAQTGMMAAAQVTDPARQVIGHWVTQDREAVIAIAPCGPALCGRIVGMTFDSPTDPTPVDNTGRTQCGLAIITGAVPEPGPIWRMRITDPRDGGVYRATMRLDARGHLLVRGYLGIELLGRTETWTPYAGQLPADCRLPADALSLPARRDR